MPIRLDIRGSNFSGRSIVFAIPELIVLKNKFLQCTKASNCYNHMDSCFPTILNYFRKLGDHNTEKIIEKCIILPMTISLECGLVGQSRILYRTCEKRKIHHNVITCFKECNLMPIFPLQDWQITDWFLVTRRSSSSISKIHGWSASSLVFFPSTNLSFSKWRAFFQLTLWPFSAS